MTVIRYVLLGISAISSLALMSFWTVSGRPFDIVLFIVLAFLITNSVYMLISRPTLRTSDILARVSTGFALASLELHHQAQEAQAREVEAEKRRLQEIEHDRYKLQVAKDMLQHLRLKLPSGHEEEVKLPQIAHQNWSDDRASPLPPPAAAAADITRLANGQVAVTKPIRPVTQTSPAPSSVSLN